MTATVLTMVAMVLVKRSGLESSSKTICIVRRRTEGAVCRVPNSLAFGGPRLQETLQLVDLPMSRIPDLVRLAEGFDSRLRRHGRSW